IWQGGLRAFGGALSAADLFVFVFYVAYIYQPLLQLTLLNEAIQNALASAERVFSILDAPPGPGDPPHLRPPERPRCSPAVPDGVVMVLQDFFLFHGTIRENLPLARPCATEAELRAAARAANVDEFVERFPDGYETLVGERGLRLSGGQKQRISIARALLKDA